MAFDLSTLLQGVLVADGAWGTHLRATGFSGPAEALNVEQPFRVEALARDYLSAGARLLTTNTFSANRLALSRFQSTLDPVALARAGAQIARRAADEMGGVVVGGVIGPSGRILAVREASADVVREAFREQALALVEGGVDLLVLETFSELEECELALEAVRAVAATMPVAACMSFDSGPQRTLTVMRAEAGECAARLTQAGADLIGSNCGAGIANALPALVALRAHTERPLWAKPSAGLPDILEGRTVYPYTADDLGAHVTALLDAGVAVLGGCCGTGPEHIRRVASLVAARQRARR